MFRNGGKLQDGEAMPNVEFRGIGRSVCSVILSVQLGDEEVLRGNAAKAMECVEAGYEVMEHLLYRTNLVITADEPA
jgi:hypothetical protein